MDTRERVYRTIRFEQPDMVPLEIHYDIKTIDEYPEGVKKLLNKHPNSFLVAEYTSPSGF